MTQDRRARTSERALQARADDPAAWLELARERQRAGEQVEAMEAVLAALRCAPGDAAALAALAELDWTGPWSAEDGDASGGSRSSLLGPREGVVVWRLELPQALIGRPLVDPDERVVVRGATSGLYRVDRDGRGFEPLGEWPADVAPILLGGEPGAFDPSAHLFRGPGPKIPRVSRSLRAATGEGWVATDKALVALDPEGVPRWRAPLASKPAALVAGPRGPVWAWLTAAGPVSLEGTLAAFERGSGQPLCNLGLVRPVAVVAGPDGGAWVASRSELLALSPEGSLLQRFPLAGPGVLARGLDQLLLATRRDGLLGLDPGTGARRWRHPDLRATLPPAVDGAGEALLVTLEGRVAAVGPGGERRFELDVDRRGPLSAPALGAGRAYLTSGRWLLAIR